MTYIFKFFISSLAILMPFTLAHAVEESTRLSPISQTTECDHMGIHSEHFVISVTMPKSAYTPTMPTINHLEGFRLIKPTRVNLQFSGSGMNNLCSYYLIMDEGDFPVIEINRQEFAIKWLAFYTKEYSSPPLCAKIVKANMQIVAPNYTTGDLVCDVEFSSL